MSKFFRYGLTAFTLFYSLVYALSCCTSVISPKTLWPMTFLALAYPYLAAGLLVLVLTWMFHRVKVAVILFLLLFAGSSNLLSSFGFFYSRSIALSSKKGLRVLTWNVRGFDNSSASVDSANSKRNKMLDYIQKSNADVLCLQEFVEVTGKTYVSNVKALTQMGYRYNFQTYDRIEHYTGSTVVHQSAIFSRLPITDTVKLLLGDPYFPEYLACATVHYRGRPLRIFTTHLKSFHLAATLVDTANRANFHNDRRIIYQASKFEKLKVISPDHTNQAAIIKKQLKSSTYPYLFTCDMNSTPASYAYHFLAKDLQDVFLHKGFGLGTTMDSLPATLRIDYILADKHLKVEGYRKDNLHLSDHFPQLVDLSWEN